MLSVWAAAAPVSSADIRAWSTMCTWRPAPSAISLMAAAISLTARPASSEVVATCCDDAVSPVAASATCPTISRRLVVMAANALPSASRSDAGVTATVRSPSAIRSAAPAIPRR